MVPWKRIASAPSGLPSLIDVVRTGNRHGKHVVPRRDHVVKPPAVVDGLLDHGVFTSGRLPTTNAPHGDPLLVHRASFSRDSGTAPGRTPREGCANRSGV